MPRAFNSQDNDMRPLSWGHAPQHHSQGRNEEQDDDGEEDNISYEDQNEVSADEDDDYEFQASKARSNLMALSSIRISYTDWWLNARSAYIHFVSF